MAQNKHRSSEKQRESFARFLRTKPDHILRRIAAAYDWASDREDISLAFEKALERESLTGFTIGRTSVTHRQGRIAYEMVIEGKYGGLTGKEAPKAPLSEPASVSEPAQPELFYVDTRPDGWPRALERESIIGKQSTEEYLREYEQALQTCDK